MSSAENDTTKNLKDKAARTRAAATDSKERERRIRRERTMRMRTDADGAFNLYLRGPALDGARLAAMLKPFQEEAFRAARSRGSVEGVKDTFDNREYDAFFNLFDHLGVLASIATHLTGTRPSPDAEPEPTNRPDDPTGPHPDPDPATSARPDDPTGAHPGPEPDPTTRPDGPTGPPPDLNTATRPEGPAGARPDGKARVTTRPNGPAGSPSGPEPDPATWPDGPRGSSPPPELPQPARAPDPDRVLDQLTPTQRAALARKLPGGNNTKIIINIDLTALRRGHTLSGETCHIDGLGPSPSKLPNN